MSKRLFHFLDKLSCLLRGVIFLRLSYKSKMACVAYDYVIQDGVSAMRYMSYKNGWCAMRYISCKDGWFAMRYMSYENGWCVMRYISYKMAGL